MSASSKRREGYLLIDNRNSPGVAGTDSVPSVGAGHVYESATKTCKHCHVVVILNPLRTRARGYCRKCDDYVCDNPACNIECVPMNQVFDVVQENNFRAENNMTSRVPIFAAMAARLRKLGLA
jgi:hypothetical protein